MNKILKGYLLTITAGILYGFIPAAARLAYAQGINSMSLTFYRNFIAMLILGVVLKIRGEPLAIADRADRKKVVILGLLCTTVTPLLLFFAYSYIPSGTASTFHFTYPALTILGTALFMHKKIHRSHVVCVLLCTAGLLLFYDPTAKLNLLGAGAALLSGITFAAYIILLDHYALTSISTQKRTFYMAGVATVVLLLVSLITGNFMLPLNLRAVGACLLVALLSTVFATVLFQKGTALIGGPRAAILSTFEPITSVIVGILVFHDPFSVRTILGSVLVIAAAILIALFDLFRLVRQGAADGEENKNEAVN